MTNLELNAYNNIIRAKIGLRQYNKETVNCPEDKMVQ